MTNPFQCLSVILPVYNEQDTLATIVSQVLEQAWVVEVLAVDDCSNDRSLAILEQLAERDQRIRIFHQAKAPQFRPPFPIARRNMF
jgi:glycosyltransferase involved in cell wall biosynthesis